MVFPRRGEDPSVDYASFRALANAGAGYDPEDSERDMNTRREAATEAIVSNIRQKPFGQLKAEVFKELLRYILEAIAIRDDERYNVDRLTYSMKFLVKEIAKRLLQRGLIAEEREVYFLAREELYELFDGHANRPLAEAKIAARMRNWDRYDRKEATLPLYLQHDRPADLGHDVNAREGLHGVGYSAGTVTAVARVIKSLSEIGRVQAGEILVCNSTDPGWTPVFLIISGIVTETGGTLSHAGCLSREYGLPCVSLPSAMQLIPDGATIEVDGDTGQVRIIDVADPSVLETVGEPAAG